MRDESEKAAVQEVTGTGKPMEENHPRVQAEEIEMDVPKRKTLAKLGDWLGASRVAVHEIR
jgi:hypothetical protein